MLTAHHGTPVLADCMRHLSPPRIVPACLHLSACVYWSARCASLCVAAPLRASFMGAIVVLRAFN